MREQVIDNHQLAICYFEGRITPSEEEILFRFVNDTPSNERLFRQWEKEWMLSYKLIPEVSNEWKQLQRRMQVRQSLNHTLGSKHWQMRRLIRVAVIACLFVLGFLNYWFNSGTGEEIAMHTVHAPVGQNAQLILADGSKIWLNAGSTLNFPSRFVGGKRQVTLEGEGFFEVKADKEKPFIVSTSVYTIKALGTSFNVKAYKQSKKFETALLTGKVEISDRMTERTLSLAPNNRAVLENNRLSVVPIEDENYYLWREGILYFDEPLTEVLDKLKLYFDVNIDVKNKSVLENKRHCTGKFRARDGLEHILNVLQLTNHFTYKKDDEKNLITIN